MQELNTKEVSENDFLKIIDGNKGPTLEMLR